MSILCWSLKPKQWDLVIYYISGQPLPPDRWKHWNSCYLWKRCQIQQLLYGVSAFSESNKAKVFEFILWQACFNMFPLQGPSWWSTRRSILGASVLSFSSCRSARMTPTASSSAISSTAATATAPGTCRSTSASTGAQRAAQCGISLGRRDASGIKWS